MMASFAASYPAGETEMRYSVSGRAPSIITAVLAMLLAATVQLLTPTSAEAAQAQTSPIEAGRQ
jgi:hypothetical protein